MFFTEDEIFKVNQILNDYNNKIWLDTLLLFSKSFNEIIAHFESWVPSSCKLIDDIEGNITTWIFSKKSNDKMLFDFTCFCVDFVLGTEDYFGTTLETYSPEVRTIFKLMAYDGISILKEESFLKRRKKVEDSLEREILNKGIPATITALNVILNASVSDLKDGAFHTFKEIINAWIDYFVINYTDLNDFDRELLTDALRLDFLEKAWYFINKIDKI